jgi:molecular chaperone DnaK (HSP70)
MNEDSPTFLEAQPPARKGEARFQVSFHIDDSKRLLISARDLKTGRWLYDRYPVVKLS